MNRVRPQPDRPHQLTHLTCWGLLLFSIILAGSTVAQPHLSLDDPGWDNRLNQLAQFEGRIVDSIIIDNQNIYDTTQANRNTFLFRTANKLHSVTRRKVISRELLIKVGEPFNLELARETTRNLRTRFELYDARIWADELPSGHIVVHLETIDQWSTFTKLKFSKESDKTGIQFGLEERNLAGYNQLLGFDYINPGDEKAYLLARFHDQRFVGWPYSFSLVYNDNPEQTIRRLVLSRPYYNLNQRWSFGVGLTDIRGRRDFYEDTTLVVQSQRQGDRFSGFINHRWGSYRDKIGINLGYTYFSERSFDVDIMVGSLFSEEMIATDTTYHYFQFRTFLQSIKYERLKQINGMGYPEDFVSGRNYSVSIGRAFTPRFDDNVYDRIDFAGAETRVIRDNLAIASFRRALWIKEGDDIQVLTEASLRWYNYSLRFMTAAFRLRYQKLTREDELNLLSLGGLNGIRGYGEFFKTGNKRVTFNAESRLFTGVEILSALFGGVFFWDAGRIWRYRAEQESVWYHSFGVGLRISMEKSSRSQIVRIDMARAQEDQWELLITTGQYF